MKPLKIDFANPVFFTNRLRIIRKLEFAKGSVRKEAANRDSPYILGVPLLRASAVPFKFA
jgi:hypothetical protein